MRICLRVCTFPKIFLAAVFNSWKLVDLKGNKSMNVGFPPSGSQKSCTAWGSLWPEIDGAPLCTWAPWGRVSGHSRVLLMVSAHSGDTWTEKGIFSATSSLLVSLEDTQTSRPVWQGKWKFCQNQHVCVRGSHGRQHVERMGCWDRALSRAGVATPGKHPALFITQHYLCQHGDTPRWERVWCS